MFDPHKTHPLLTQVPLTVSPYLSMPTAVTLPYTFRSVPSSLPPTITSDGGKAPYVKSASGKHAAHPDDIIDACRSLQENTTTTAENDRKLLEKWEAGLKERDLAEKRRVAPGWLDREEKILEPTRANAKKEDLLADEAGDIAAPAMSPSREGEELDRVFGKMGVK